VPIALYDKLIIEPSHKLTLICNNPEVPTDENNTIIRAIKSLQEELNINDGAHIVLEKHIPIQAGLGGGSSNAATAMKGVLQLWQANIQEEKLYSIAAQIGSDVPFFIFGKPAWAWGKGEILKEHVGLGSFWLILIDTGVKINTAEAYRELRMDLTKETYNSKLLNLTLFQGHAQLWVEHLCNDFTEVVYRLYPELTAIRDLLLEKGVLGIQLSGSGGALFALCENRHIAEKIANYLLGEDIKAKALKALV